MIKDLEVDPLTIAFSFINDRGEFAINFPKNFLAIARIFEII